MTLGIDLYPWFALVSSVAIVVLFTAHALDAGRDRRTYHDDRSAVELLIALTLAVASLGLLAGAAARFVDGRELQVTLGNVGLGIVRGALLTTGCVLFLMDRRDFRRRS